MRRFPPFFFCMFCGAVIGERVNYFYAIGRVLAVFGAPERNVRLPADLLCSFGDSCSCFESVFDVYCPSRLYSANLRGNSPSVSDVSCTIRAVCPVFARARGRGFDPIFPENNVLVNICYVFVVLSNFEDLLVFKKK